MSRTTRRRLARLEAQHQQVAPTQRETIVGADGQRWTRIANGLVVPEVMDADAWQAQAIPQQQSLVNSEE